jgi:hypothetical protein
VNVFLGAASIPGKEFVVTKAGPEFVLKMISLALTIK